MKGKRTMFTAKKCLALGAAALGLLTSLPSVAEPLKPVCVVPAKPGGGFDLTCRIAAAALEGTLKTPMQVTCPAVLVQRPTNSLPPPAAGTATRWWPTPRARC
jgi:hypothetical protein